MEPNKFQAASVQSFDRGDMKLSSYSIKHIWPFCIGMGYLLFPYFDGWSEICCPRLSRIWLGAFLLWHRGWIIVFFALQLIYFCIAFVKKWSLKSKSLIIILAIVYLLMWQVSYPTDTTGTDRRIGAFVLGGQTRLVLAGGSMLVHQEALDFIDTVTNLTPPVSECPSSVKALGVSLVKIDKTTGTMVAYIHNRGTHSDQFGYIFQDVSAADPQIVHNHRIWKLAAGIYLFEIW